jgi:hypothetical protein
MIALKNAHQGCSKGSRYATADRVLAAPVYGSCIHIETYGSDPVRQEETRKKIVASVLTHSEMELLCKEGPE